MAEQFCLKWTDFQSSILNALDSLKSSEDLVDVTLTCEGQNIKAHKVVLSACSPYFRDVFKENPCRHPIVILKDVLARDAARLLAYMYRGQVQLPEAELPSFLQAAALLQVRGLTTPLATLNVQGKKIQQKSPTCPTTIQTKKSATQPGGSPKKIGEAGPTELCSTPGSKSSATPTKRRRPSTDKPADCSPEGSKKVKALRERPAEVKTEPTSEEEEPSPVQVKHEPEPEVEECGEGPAQDSGGGSPDYEHSMLARSLLSGVQTLKEGPGLEPEVLLAEAELPAPNHAAICGDCPHCGTRYSNQSALKYHVRLMHSDLGNRLCCYLCPRSFTMRDTYKDHMWSAHGQRN